MSCLLWRWRGVLGTTPEHGRRESSLTLKETRVSTCQICGFLLDSPLRLLQPIAGATLPGFEVAGLGPAKLLRTPCESCPSPESDSMRLTCQDSKHASHEVKARGVKAWLQDFLAAMNPNSDAPRKGHDQNIIHHPTAPRGQHAAVRQ